MQARLETELHVNQLELQKLKLAASANRLQELSPAAEFILQTQLAEAESDFAAKQNEMAEVTTQLLDHREVLAALQQVELNCRAVRLFPRLHLGIRQQSLQPIACNVFQTCRDEQVEVSMSCHNASYCSPCTQALAETLKAAYMFSTSGVDSYSSRIQNLTGTHHETSNSCQAVVWHTQDDKALDKAWKKESSETGEALGPALYQLFRKRLRYAQAASVDRQ